MADPHFQGKTALVTGAGNGIGRASALGFARRGARVMVADIDEAAAADTARSIREAGGEAEYMACDATKEAAVAALIRTTVDRLGGLNFAHNNIGAMKGQKLEEVTEEDYYFTSDICMKSVFLGMKHEVKAMRECGGGAIVNTASMAGASTTDSSNVIYSGAKAAVIHMTAYVARMYAPENIRVNCVAPGLVSTKIIADMFNQAEQDAMASGQLFKRILQPEEIAATVLYLCSAEASMITGIMVPVDGGMNAIF